MIRSLIRRWLDVPSKAELVDAIDPHAREARRRIAALNGK